MAFLMDFWSFCMCFMNVLFKAISNLKFYKCCFIKEDLHKYHRMVSCAPKKSIG